MGKQIVFIGGIWTQDQELNIIENSKGGVQSAANALQMNIISGIDELNGTPTTIINEIFIGSFPKLYKKLLIKNGNFNHATQTKHIDYNVGFINLPYFKHISRFYSSKKYLKKICEKCYENEICVFGYSMTQSVVKGLLYAKKINPKLKTCLIVPDLPEYMNLSGKKSLLFKVLKKANRSKLYKSIKGIDSFVVLTKQMYSKLGVEKPYVVMEGIAPDPLPMREQEDAEEQSSTKNIVYTGTLNKKYGICDLVDAFCDLKGDELRLVICGAGNSSAYINERAKSDKRIEFLGVVENKVAKQIQQKAYILVNPRSGDDEYTKYSFPSKTMEYMMSGRPVVMNKLEGIPKEYDNYLYYIQGSLKETLKFVMQLPNEELEEKGKKAREFVMNNKNRVAQVKKILSLTNDIK